MSLLNCACSQEKNIGIQKESQPFEKKVKEKSSASKLSAKEQGESSRLVQNNSNMTSTGGVSLQYEPDSQLYQLSAVIGKGHMNSSSVFLAKHIPSSTLVAVKKINLELWDKELSYLQNEIILTQQMSHPNILPFYSTFISQQDLWCVMPLMAFGSCHDLILAFFNSGLPEQAMSFIIRDLLNALDYIHQRGIIHRGVKSSHVLIGKNGVVCLSGFHNSHSTIENGKIQRRIHDLPLHAVDSLHCFSPELLEQNLAGYTFKSDIYSLGILTCELANGQSPFADMPVTQGIANGKWQCLEGIREARTVRCEKMLLEKLSGTKPRLADATTVGEFIIDDNETEDQTGTPQERADAIFFQRTFTPALHDFVSICLERDPNLRPTANLLLSHQVLKNIKNRSSAILPTLLHPVTPLTDIAKVCKVMPTEDEDFTRKMSEVSMQEDWTF